MSFKMLLEEFFGYCLRRFRVKLRCLWRICLGLGKDQVLVAGWVEVG